MATAQASEDLAPRGSPPRNGAGSWAAIAAAVMAAWVVVVPLGGHSNASRSVPVTVVAWLVMVAAMMLPTLVPMLRTLTNPLAGRQPLTWWPFVGGYAAVWTALALWIDDRATDEQVAALETIFAGRARGSIGLFSLLVSRSINGAVRPIGGARPGEEVMITNSEYWMGSEVIVAEAVQGRVRAFGRVWNFEGRSAEICSIRWEGP